MDNETNNEVKEIVKKEKEPLFHIVKRDNIPTRNKVFIRMIAIAVAIVLAELLILIIGGDERGEMFLKFIPSLFKGMFNFNSGKAFVDTLLTFLKDVAILLGLGLALLPAFKMKFWNIGADGQAIMGALASYVTFYFLIPYLPNFLVTIIALIAAMVFSIIWAVIPAIFKAFFNTNETLFTLMMNYVAIQLVAIFIYVCDFGGSHTVKAFLNMENETGKNVGLFGLSANGRCFLIIAIVAIITFLMYIYLKKTKHGFELSLVGESEKTAKYVGINVKRVVIRTLIVSGAICGIIGFMLTTFLNGSISENTLGGKGFTAIIVCWLAEFNPLYMILTAFMVIFLNKGVSVMASSGGASVYHQNAIASVFFFCLIACTFFINYKIVFNRKNSKGINEDKFVVSDDNQPIVELSAADDGEQDDERKDGE